MDNFAIVILPDEAKAAQASSVLQELDQNGGVDLYELAVIHHDPQGRTAVAAQGVPGAAIGGVVGGLIGLLGGPVGLAVGAVSGAWIGTLRDLNELGAGADFAERVRRELAPGKAALVVELDEQDPDLLDRRIGELDGIVVRGSAEDPEEADLAQRAAILKAEFLSGDGASGSVSAAAPSGEVSELRARVQEALERLRRRTAERVARLEQDAAEVSGEAREQVLLRIAAANERAARREASLQRTLELLDSARGSA